MSGVKHNVSNTPTGNPLVDGVIAGGTIWDTTQGPVKIAIYNKSITNDWASLMDSRNGVPSDVITHSSLTRYWTGQQGTYMYEAAAAFEAVSGIKFERAASHAAADILWFAAGYLSVHAKSGGLPTFGEGPSDVHQTWGYLADNSPYSPDGPTHGDWDFRGAYDPKGGIGFQNELTLVAQTLGLKVGANSPFGSPFSLMSRNFVPADSSKSDGYGFMKTPGAVEIAAVQALYGANMQTATGNDSYVLPTNNTGGVGWTTIWDAGGIDTLSAAGSTKPVSINLNAASLDANDPNGGGFLSRQINVYGGFSIAKGVVIENATGGSSNDLLIGNEAANRLSGGLGKDKLKGLGGNDVFLFNTAPGPANVDRIVDFSVADDTIQLSKSVFSHVQASKGILKSSAFWKGKAAHDANDHVVYDHVGGGLYYDPDGKGGAAAIKIATLAAGLKMTAADFVLV